MMFVSYARRRLQEADLAEMTLRRRGLEVFRDEHDFAAGAHLMGEIEEHLAGCDVFVALWSRDRLTSFKSATGCYPNRAARGPRADRPMAVRRRNLRLVGLVGGRKLAQRGQEEAAGLPRISRLRGCRHRRASSGTTLSNTRICSILPSNSKMFGQ